MKWTLRKTDGQAFEGRSLEEIVHWARSAQINPYDELSEDGRVWKKAFEMQELGMEWLVTLNDGTEYGPTNLATLAEFVSVKLLSEESLAMNRRSNQRRPVAELLKEHRDGLRAEKPMPGQGAAPPPEHPPSAPLTFAAVFGRRTPGPPSVPEVPAPAAAVVDYQVQPLPSPLEGPPPVPANAIMPDSQVDPSRDPEFLEIEKELLLAKSNYNDLLKKYEKLVQKLPKNPAAERQ